MVDWERSDARSSGQHPAMASTRPSPLGAAHRGGSSRPSGGSSLGPLGVGALDRAGTRRCPRALAPGGLSIAPTRCLRVRARPLPDEPADTSTRRLGVRVCPRLLAVPCVVVLAMAIEAPQRPVAGGHAVAGGKAPEAEVLHRLRATMPGAGRWRATSRRCCLVAHDRCLPCAWCRGSTFCHPSPSGLVARRCGPKRSWTDTRTAVVGVPGCRTTPTAESYFLRWGRRGLLHLVLA